MVRLMLAVLAWCVFAMPVSAEAKSRHSSSKSYSSSHSFGSKSSRSSRKTSGSSRKADSASKGFGFFGSTPKPAQAASPSTPASPPAKAAAFGSFGGTSKPGQSASSDNSATSSKAAAFGSFGSTSKPGQSASSDNSATSSKAAAFGSFGNAPKPTPSASPGLATSALSGDLSKRAAQAAALSTLDQGNRRADTQSNGSLNNTATSSGHAPAYANANNPAAPQPASYNGGGNSDHSFLWYMLGRLSGEHDGDNHAAQAAQYSSTGNNAAYPSADKESSSSWGVWIIVTILLVGAVYFVYRRNKNQPAEGQTGNYTL